MSYIEIDAYIERQMKGARIPGLVRFRHLPGWQPSQFRDQGQTIAKPQGTSIRLHHGSALGCSALLGRMRGCSRTPEADALHRDRSGVIAQRGFSFTRKISCVDAPTVGCSDGRMARSAPPRQNAKAEQNRNP